MAARRGFTLAQVAAALGGRVEGDASRVVRGVAPLEEAGPEDIAFVADPRYLGRARSSKAAALLVADNLDGLSGPLVRCRSPRQALAELLTLFHPPAAAPPGVSPKAVVASDATIDPTASVGALAVIEAGAVVGPGVRVYPLVYVGAEARIGESTVLHPHVVVGARVVVGRRVIVHPGAVLGADGFGFVFDGVEHRKIPQVGGLVVEDDVEIGANTTIDRATLGDTVVRRGAKIDNLVMVAHNVEVGEHSIIAGQSGIAGSSRLERGVVLGGQVGVGDHVTIGAGAMLGARTGVVGNVTAGEKLLGDYGLPIREFQRIALAQRRLPDLLRRVRALERRLARLEGGEGGLDEDDDER